MASYLFLEMEIGEKHRIPWFYVNPKAQPTTRKMQHDVYPEVGHFLEESISEGQRAA